MLIRPFTIEEAKKATFAIWLDSAAGVDGFSSAFFTHSWEVVGQSIVNAANGFLHSKLIPYYLTHACLVMIPKANTSVFLADFWPISLCSTMNKIFARMIFNKLATHSPKLITPNQDVFTKERSIFDNIALTQEICHELVKSGETNLILNLNIHKAYDILKWDFLFAVLFKFGFSKVG